MPKKSKKQKKKIKKYAGLFAALAVIVFIIFVFWNKKTAPEPEILYPEADQQWEVRTQPLTQEKFEAAPQKFTNEVIDNKYLTATFSDSFSSMAWLDTDKTTLYFDWTGTNLLFPPDVAVEEVAASPLLQTFVPELTQKTNSTVVFAGHHLLNNQKAVMVWERSNDTWTRMNFDTLGIPQEHAIISIYPVPTLDQWIVFTKEKSTARFHVYKFDRDMANIDDADLGTIPQDVSFACGSVSCLIYYADSAEFFSLDVALLKLGREKELQNVVREKDFNSVLIQTGNNVKERWIIGLVQEQAFEIWQYEPLTANRSPVSLIFSQTFEYPGRLAFFSRADGRVFVLWASYFTKAYEISMIHPVKSDNVGAAEPQFNRVNDQLSITDLSQRFGWRISQNSAVQLHELSNAVYIINSDGTMIRFNGEINTRIDNLFWFNFSPSFLKIIPNNQLSMINDQVSPSGYVVAGIPGGGTKLYQFTDYGYDLGAIRSVVSKQVNFEVKAISAAQISGLESGSSQAKIHYFLSNDGGASWQETELGQVVKFKTSGNDLRWKITIAPYKNADTLKTPYLRSINLTYWYEK